MNERYRLPDGWEWTTLGMLGEYINGRAFNDNDWSRRGTPIIRIQNLTGTSDTFNYYEGEIEDKYIVQPGELLVAWSATLGAYLWNGPKAYLNQHIFKVVSYIDRTFHYYLVQSIIEELYRNAHGSGMVHVTRGKFEAIPISLPPLQEQHRIVAAIEEKFTQLDATIATLRKDREKLKQARTSLLKAAVEGTLTQKWREQHPDVEPAEDLLARILHERREKWETAQLARMHERGIVPKDDKWKDEYREPAEPDMTGLMALPEGWCWATVEQVSYSVKYGTSAKTSDDSSGVPVLRMGNIQSGNLVLDNLKYLPQSHPEFPNLLLEKGDLLFNRTNSLELVGKSAVYKGEFDKCSFASYLISVRTFAQCSVDYLCFFLNSWYGRNWIVSVYTQQTGQANVNGSKLQALAFPLPPLEEQRQIVAEVERRLSGIESAELAIEENLRRAEQMRQSVLQRAFRGELVPQDADDEPARVLLERIREEQKRREQEEQQRRKGRTSLQESMF